MLDDLDAIDWTREAHALGPAVEIPTWLRAIAGTRAKARGEALAALSNAIAHQGWAAPVALRVVPFLLELAARGRPCRAGVLRLLADLSVGGNHESYASLRLDLAEMPAQLDAWMPELRSAVLEGEAGFVEALGDADPVVRGAAAVATAFATHDAARAMAALEARLGKESDPGALASALCAIGYAARRARAPLPKSVAGFQAHADGMVRAAAGVAAFYVDVAIPKRCAAALLGALAATEPCPPSFAYGGGDLRALAAIALAGDAARRRDDAALKRLFAAAPAAERLSIAQRVMALLFDDVPAPRIARDLTEPQRAWLEVLTRTNVHPWTRAAHWYGIPTRHGLRRYLHGSPHPLDRTHGDAPLWRHCFAALHGELTTEAWQGLLRSALRGDEVLALCADAYAFESYLLYPWPPQDRTADPGAHEAHTLTFWGRTLAACCSPAAITKRLDELLARLPRSTGSESLACTVGLLESESPLDARHDRLLSAACSVVAPAVWERVLQALPEARREPLASGLHPRNRRP